MARYDSAIYGVSTYDSNPAAVSLGDVTISAVQIGTTSVRVTWRNPSATHVQRVIMRSTVGVPPDPVSGQGVILVQVDATNSADPNTNLTSLTDTVLAGSEDFYTLFVQIVDPDNPNAVRWVLGADAYVSMVTDHGTFARFRSAFPSAFTTTNGSAPGGPVDTAEPLSVVMSVVAGVFDNLLTEADRLKDLWDGHHVPSRMLGAVAQSMGLPIEPHLGPKPQRAMVVNATTIAKMRGTLTGIQTLATCLSGKPTSTAYGKNIVPGVGASAYEKQYVFATTLAAAVTTNVQTQIDLASILGWPVKILNTDTYPKSSMWLTVRSSTGTEVMQVTKFTGNRVTVTRGQKGTVAQASHAAASPVTLSFTYHGWEVQPGYDLEVLDTTGAGFAMPTATSTSADQPPLQAYCLKITRVNATGTIVTPEVTLSGLRWVAAYSRSGKIGTVTTMCPHELTAGVRVKAYFGAASATTPSAVYSVLSVLDPFTFTVLHTETSLSDATMAASDLVTATPPYVEAYTIPTTTVPITTGLAYTYAVRVRAGTTTRGVQATITWLDVHGTPISTATGSSVNSVSGSWTVASVTATAPANTVLAGISVKYDTAASWAAGETHYVAQHQVEQAAAATGYDDGGLVRLGINGSPEIDPYKVIRLRTRELLKSMASDAKTYRVEFLKRTLDLPTASAYATITVPSQTWTDIDVRIRMIPNALSGTQQIMAANSLAGPAQWVWTLNATTLGLTLNTSTVTTVTSSAHGLSAATGTWLRFVRISSTGAITFYKGTDAEQEPYVWTQISTHAGTAGALGATTPTLTIGSTTTGGLVGHVHYMRLVSGLGEPVDIDPWLYDAFRNRIPSNGFLVADWVLSSTAPDAVTITTTFP